MDDPDAGATVKSWPVPERLTRCGLPMALLVIVIVPVIVPAALGQMSTVMVHVPLGAMGEEATQLSDTSKFAAGEEVIKTLEIVKGTAPVFVTVMG